MHSNGPIRENNIGQYFLHGMYAPLYSYFPVLIAEKMPLFCFTRMTNKNSNDQIHMQTFAKKFLSHVRLIDVR